MKPTHCILYNPIDRTNCDETKGTCLDYHDREGTLLPCMDAIEKGYCCKKRKTPVL